MLDKNRILSRIDELDGFLQEISEVKPDNFEDYKRVEKRRSCERLLQLSIECVIDIAKLFVSGRRLGLPSEENDIFEKLYENSIISEETMNLLKTMRGFRNIIIHEYAKLKDELVFEFVKNELDDFEIIKQNFLKAIKSEEI